MEINYSLIGILIDRGQELINRGYTPQNQEIVQTKTKASFLNLWTFNIDKMLSSCPLHWKHLF